MKNINGSNKIEATISDSLPIAAHIFEGYLYLKDDNTNKWLWRLFRFDGLCLTCLSSKKYKLPPHTLLDAPAVTIPTNNERQHLSFLSQNTSTTSLTSPLYATLKDKSARITTPANNKNNLCTAPVASYYQLPKWTVQMINVSSISILKPNQIKPTATIRVKSLKHTLLPISNISNSLHKHTASQTKLKCFSICTYDGKCYNLRAHKQRDFERWVFVLAKMWRFAQAARHMYHHTEPAISVSLTPQYHPSTSSDPQLSPTARLSMSLNESVNSFPLDLDNIIATERKKDCFYTAKSDISRFYQKNQMNEATTESSHSNNKHIMLSREKTLWIEEWVKSLAALQTRKAEELDYMTELSSPVPSIHNVEKQKRSTSVPQQSIRKSSLRYRAVHQRSPSIRQRSESVKRRHIIPVQPSTAIPSRHANQQTVLTQAPSSTSIKSLKAESRKSNNRKSYPRSASAGNLIAKINDDRYIDFFQDANTVQTDESTTNTAANVASVDTNATNLKLNLSIVNNNNSIKIGNRFIKKEIAKHSLKYHNSFRAHPVKIIRNSTSNYQFLTAPTIPIDSLPLHINQRQQASPKDHHQPLECLRKNVNYTYNTTEEAKHEKYIELNSSDSGSRNDDDHDENVCLEDIRRSLQSVDLNSRKPLQLSQHYPSSIHNMNERARPRSALIATRTSNSSVGKQNNRCRNSWAATITSPHHLNYTYDISGIAPTATTTTTLT
ncbi:hypothetical protein BDF20DRAFT_851056 [Mycotypha africana]|uniref:uncharacterized protein n=1 Tax=Mycotypha africana TaxID=64632 RepID=UPI002301A31E|nr:uncharacterized protein BDF20DRAFT_851056 [Mycotypha africana]KAI8987590.1 hypothetical protein BDF20DRAFT_851056 [Mycotypha africana]